MISSELLCVYTITHWAMDSWIMCGKLELQLRLFYIPFVYMYYAMPGASTYNSMTFHQVTHLGIR